MIGDSDRLRELRGDSRLEEGVSDQLDGGGAHGQGGAALAGGPGGDTPIVTSLNEAPDLISIYLLCYLFLCVYFLFHLVAVVVVALGLAGTALTHRDGGELPGLAEDRGAGHVVTAAVPGAEGGVRTAGSGADRGQVTIGAEAGLTLCVQTRRLQGVKTEERVWAAMARGHWRH